MLSQNSEGSTKKIISVGPWGGKDSLLWDDGVFSAVRKVVVAHGFGIHYIQIEYDKNGSSIWSDKHGGVLAYRLNKVSL